MDDLEKKHEKVCKILDEGKKYELMKDNIDKIRHELNEMEELIDA